MTTTSPFWPAGLPHHLRLPETNLFYNAQVAATRYPDKPFTIFYGGVVTFARFRDEAELMAGYLQQVCGVQAGDRVLLYMQNSPQWMIAYYAILRANAVVVPVNPMNLTGELRHYVEDSGARTGFVSQELYERIEPLVSESRDGGEEPHHLHHLVVATYSDYIAEHSEIPVPDFVAAPRHVRGPGVRHWADALAAGYRPGALTNGPEDLCVMPYTSGTTGAPKGCMHTHRNVMATAVSSVHWVGVNPEAVQLLVLPLFHVTGMQSGMNGALYCTMTVVILPRWDRNAAAQAIASYGVTTWTAISTMVVDFLANPELDRYDISSLKQMSGGGAAMPEAMAKKLADKTGIQYIEGYGMTETMAGTHVNPPARPKRQCLGIPTFDVDARVIDLATLRELPQGEVGEIVMHGPQVMRGYWGKPEATQEAFIEIDGKRFLRSGDLGRVDEEGYFFMVDRLKRMINASGYKVWPAEVEALMYRHPAIQEVCVIGARDAHRGETVKALVVLHAGEAGRVSSEDIVAWAHGNMAAYKAPRIVEMVEALPKSGSGKILWRVLQEQQEREASPRVSQALRGTG